VNILVVDDSSFARKSAVKLIGRINPDIEIVQAGSGEEALEILDEILPDIVFLDLTMPGLNGLDVLEKVQNDGKNLKVVVVTADIQHKTKDRVFELGAFDMINKPLDEAKVRKIFQEIESL